MGFNQIINKYSNYIFIIGNISVFKLNVIKYHLIKNNTSPKFNNLAKDQAWWMRMGTWLHGFINARFFGCKIFFLYIQKPKKKKKKKKKKNSVEVRYFLHNVLSNFNSTTMESTLAKKKREICLVNDTSDCC